MAVFACAATSCSEADEPTFDQKFSRSLSEGTAAVTYERTGLRLFDQNPLTNGKWKEVDLSDLYGWSATSSPTIIIQDGKIWTDYVMWYSHSGPTLIGRIWGAYLFSTKKDLNLYLSRKFEINEEDSSIDINGNMFTVGHIDKTSFRLIHFSDYAGGESGKGGIHKEISDYKATASATIGSNVVAFDTEMELCRSVIDLAREHFGEIIDMNKVYAGLIEYTTPQNQFINLHDAEIKLGLISE